MKKLIKTIITAIITILLVTPLSSCYSSIKNKNFSQESISYKLTDDGQEIVNERFESDANKFLELYYLSSFLNAGITFNPDGIVVIHSRTGQYIQGTYSEKINCVEVIITRAETNEHLLEKTIKFDKILDKLTLNLLPIEENLSQYFTKIVVTYKSYKSPF